MANIGMPGLIMILVVALIVFGPSRLPELGKAVGSTLKEFKKSVNDVSGGLTDEIKDVKETVNKAKEL